MYKSIFRAGLGLGVSVCLVIANAGCTISWSYSLGNFAASNSPCQTTQVISTSTAQPTLPTQVDRLLPGQALTVNRSLTSRDGRFYFLMQGDGNLVLYGPGSQPLWSSNTYNLSDNLDVVVMQGDGNLVIYDAQGHSLWASNTYGSPGATLLAQNDGNLVIYDVNGHALWASNTWMGHSNLAQ